MNKTYLFRMQILSVQLIFCRISRAAKRISDNRMPDLRHVNTYLMRSARFETEFNKGIITELGNDAVMRYRRF